MNNETIYSEKELYPKRISHALGEMGTPVEEQSLVEQYLWSTFGGESIDF